MSHFRQRLLTTIGVTAVLVASTSFVTAEASITDAQLKTAVTPSSTQSTSFSSLKPISGHPVLDWRNSSQTFSFDVPDMNWTSNLKVTLSADPVGNVSKTTPLFIQLNDDEPIKVSTRGRGFDATVSLNPAKLRTRNNRLRVFFGEQSGSECLLPQDGTWTVNLDKSKIWVRSNAKSRNLRLSDVKSLFGNPLTEPKTIGLVSFGLEKPALDSLLAQGMGLRLSSAPRFTTSSGLSDIDIIAGRRDEIARYVRDKSVLKTKGPLLTLDSSRPARLIITGDTNDEVLSVAKAFAQFQLPETSRASTSPGELKMQPLLSEQNVFAHDKTKLSELGDTAFEQSWNPKEQVLTFNVEDPLASQGEVLLRIASPKEVTQTNSRLSLELNGRSLGQTQLDKSRKTVSFKIPDGILVGQDNVLRLQPSLETNVISGCASQNYATNGVYLSDASKLVLTQKAETPLGDLSRFSATGAPFSDAGGRDTLIVLPKGKSDYHAALSVLAKLAESKSEGWKEASFIRGTQGLASAANNKNVLFILPSKDLPNAIVKDAPKSLRAALKGQSFKGDNLLSAEVERYADVSDKTAYQSAARKLASRNNIRRGGVAAIYRSPYQNNKMAAVITNSSNQPFVQSVRTLTEDEHWNALEGRVARWNEKTVLMAELSAPIAGFERSELIEAPSLFDGGIRGLAFADLNLPNLSDVTLDMTQFKPSIDWASLKDKAMFWDKTDTDNAPILLAEVPVKMAEAGLPPAKKLPFITAGQAPVSGNKVPDENSNLTVQPAEKSPTDIRSQLRLAGESHSFKTASIAEDTLEKGKSFLDSVLPESAIEKTNRALTGSPSQRQGILRDLTERSHAKPKTPKISDLERKAHGVMKASGEKFASFTDGFKDFKMSERVANLQKKWKPVGNSWRAKLRQIPVPGESAAKWSVRQISAAGLLLMLIFGFVIYFLGLSSASSRTGDHH
jgi:hypothetical protein